MNFEQVFINLQLLQGNPNTGRLSNKSRIIYMRVMKELKDEFQICRDNQEEIYKKYKLKADGNSYEKAIADLKKKNKVQWAKFDRELFDLFQQEASLKKEHWNQFAEDEFFTLTADRTTKIAGETNDFFYSAGEIALLSEILLTNK